MPKDSKTNKANKNKAKKPGKSTKGKNDKIKERAEANSKQIEEQKTDPINQNQAVLIPQDDNPDIQRGLYSDELLPKLEKLAASGLNNNQIAQALGIGNRTFYDWRDKYPQFLHSLNKYRGVADIQVENALFKSALGYSVEELTQERKRIAPKEYALVTTAITTKHVSGSAAAQIFYLKNRMPERYRDKVEVAHGLAGDAISMTFTLKRRGE